MNPRSTPHTHEWWVSTYSDLALEGLIRAIRRTGSPLTDWQHARLKAAQNEQKLREEGFTRVCPNGVSPTR